MAKKKTEQFEDALKKLQAIVEKLERGDLPLEDALDSFTEGIRLAQFCQEKLESAESRVRTLLGDGQGNWNAAPFDPPSETSEE